MIAYERVGARAPGLGVRTRMVPMRDGVTLATDLYLAGGVEGAGPVVLIRLPYDKNGEYTAMAEIAGYLCAHGYHVVVQDVRGKFASEGETVMFVHEAADGYDTIDWIAGQPWSDGNVGMWGDSYYGFTQFAAASTGHRALKAIVPRLTGTRLGALPRRQFGSRAGEVEMGVHRLYPLTFFQSNEIFLWEMDWGRRPLSAVAEEWFHTVGHRSLTYDRWMADPDSDQRFPFGHVFEAPAIPTLMTIGLWDNCAPWQWHDHEAMATTSWADHEYLLVEPIDHENYSIDDVPVGPHNDHATNPEALSRSLPRMLDPGIEFFDVFLRDRGSSSDIDRVRYRVVGHRSQQTSAQWPPASTVEARWCGGPDGVLGPSPGSRGERSWIHDPDDPVPSPVSNAFAFLAEFPDERSLVQRDDVCSFVGDALREAVLLLGPLRCEFEASSSGPEMDLFVRLCDQSPDGAAHLIARGQVTVHDARQGASVTVALGHAAFILQPGHRMRLTIASSDAPEFVPAPGNGQDRWSAVERVPNRQRVILPVVLTASIGALDSLRD